MALTKVPSNLDATIATTQSQGNNSTNIATTAYVDLAVSNLSDSAPAALNTLNEIAAALGDDANYASTTTAAIAAKLPLAGGTMTGNLTVNAIVDADNFKVNGAQGSDGQVLTSTGSGIAWESIPAGGVAGIVTSADATAITIDSLENVGIGVVPEAWYSYYDVLQIGSGASLAGSTTNKSRAFLNANVYINSSNAQSYIATDEASQYWQNGGTHIFNVAASGTADSTISWTTAMTIDSTGKVGIGTISPSAPLDIVADNVVYVAEFTQSKTSNGDGVLINIGSAAAADYALTVRSDAGNTSVLACKGDGKVGIGTFVPDEPLHIYGSGYQRLKIQATGSGSGADLQLKSKNDSTQWILFNDSDSGNNSGVIKYVHSTNKMHFRTNDIDDRLVISSDGNVGIGTSAPGNVLDVTHSAGAHTPVLRLTGSSTSGYAAGLEWYSGYGPKVSSQMFSTASGSQGGEYWQEVRNQSSNTLKRTYHVSNAAKHTFYGQHNGDSTGHFLFSNQLHDAASTNCSLVVQNGYTFIQVMGWTSLGARIGTRTGGWSGNSGGDVHFTRNDSMQIKLGSSGPVLSNGTAISSDERLKKNIANVADGQLAKINALTVRTFEWKNPDSQFAGTQEGFIAQEVESVIPEAVKEETMAPDPHDESRDFEGDVKLLKHDVINARLIKAVQELSAKLEAAEARITTLEG